jgi:hypothetical protein
MIEAARDAIFVKNASTMLFQRDRAQTGSTQGNDRAPAYRPRASAPI